jgi:hypothetical protein
LKTIEFSFWQLGQVNRILYPDRDPFTVVLMEVFIIIPYLRDAFHEKWQHQPFCSAVLGGMHPGIPAMMEWIADSVPSKRRSHSPDCLYSIGC